MNGKTRRPAALAAVVMGMVWALALLNQPQLAADSRWGANYFPNVTLTTQNGDDVKFYDLIKGKIVAIDLIYTNCQYACPLESARLARMQQLLGDRMGRDVFFISISIDPEHDTPAALKAYAAQYDAGPGWIFLTGKMTDIDLLSKKLGLWSDPTLTQDGHTPMLLIGNEASGQWTQTSALDNPAYTAKIISTWMNSWQTAKPEKSYLQAAPITNRDNGKYLFTSLCANCHTIGRGDKIGPDLAVAFTTRERDWLARYTLQPDVLRIKNDPIAKALMKTFGEVRMPNLGLEADEVKAILRYIEQASTTTSSTVTPLAATATAAAPRGNETRGVPPLVDGAIAIQVALAHDSIDGLGDKAAALRQAAASAGPAAAAIERASADLARQTTIADARRAYGVMSDALITYLKSAGTPLAAGVRVAYCPMVRKSWLQMDGPLANPYYGSKMLGCGEFTTITD
jgi:protein SCO1/2